jgi:4-hydroxythreonine-4-phosphate dehydrogenase
VALGLPILRRSVDHGTAFDIAGKDIANAEIMVDVAEPAMQLVEGLRRETDNQAEAMR